jgi:hypothetical protein
VRHKEPPITKLVLDWLRLRDDFATRSMIAHHTKCRVETINAALHWLRKCRAVDVIVEPDGRGWWFAMPEECDQRIRVMKVRAVEDTRKVRSAKRTKTRAQRIKS